MGIWGVRMNSQRTTYRLADLCELRAGSGFKLDLQGKPVGDYPFIKVSDMNLSGNETRIRVANNWISEADREKLRAKPFPFGTTVFAKIGEALKQNRLRLITRNTIIDNNMMGAIPEQGRVDPEYFYYALSKFDFGAISGGTALPYLTVSALNELRLELPPQKEQRAIAHILGTFDEKIELNRRMNETLEVMARAIFQSWFVDFDPVRAKASGESADAICQRLGLTHELLALFPDSFEDSEVGEIPAGWEVTTLQSMTSKIGSGATPRGGREVYVDEGVSLIRSQNVYDSQFVWEGLARITDEAAKQLSGVEVKLGDVLINITGASILRTCVVEPEVLPARVNQHVAIIRAKAKSASRYIHLHLLTSDMKAYLMGLNAGASREAVTKSHLESVPIINPGTSLLERFSETVAPLYVEIEQLAQQRRTLQNLRDALLPKLLAGELVIPLREDYS